ncbi:MAG: hypothetical protein NTV57_19250 [Cyanobacteria bacterium]|nr:hypothetical protein [Cyanobacteriota bacterium]
MLLQPTAEAINTCRQLGYGVLALGESPQPDVLGLPLEWRDLQHWLLEQLPEAGGPQVLLVGAPEGAAGELAIRPQQPRPQWRMVGRATELPAQAEAMRLLVLPGWHRQDLRVLASSSGLRGDGWLETQSRLVIQLYLPAEWLVDSDPALQVQLTHWPNAQPVELQPGCFNCFCLQTL